ncbi:hypothetical protein FHU38_001205 [Saccharomonospora amisosensis]|uniref:YcxB-like C-terminal domain-containing protein n=1 Tax=Saccharomonospora amisosensis TaxID=1128677 RepID=A0A7X5UMQ4_9PSEU|nr:YcxB family protein [Saccharomonospora amisosensis]NIJ10861.1 hypothetical protein [Saccharomonospora amisosensis]
MQISMKVPYDESQLRRTLRFLFERRMPSARPQGVALVALGGVGVGAAKFTDMFSDSALLFWASSALISCGVMMFFIARISVRSAMRTLPGYFRLDQQVLIDSEWLTVSSTGCESRMHWSWAEEIVETAEGWYALFGKSHVQLLPKNAMSTEEQAAFGQFAATLKK